MGRSFGLTFVVNYCEGNQADDHAREGLEEVRYVPRLADSWGRWSRVFIITIVSIIKIVAITVVIYEIIIGAVITFSVIEAGHLVIVIQFFGSLLGLKIRKLLFICHRLREIVDLSISVIFGSLFLRLRLEFSLALVLIWIILRVFLPFIVCHLLAHSSFQLIVVCSNTNFLSTASNGLIKF